MRIFSRIAADAFGLLERAVVTIEEGRITAVERASDGIVPHLKTDLDARDWLLVPGFIDIHVHGGAGRSVMEATEEALEAISSHLARHGVTGYLATTVTGPCEQLTAVLATVSRWIQEGEQVGARVLGCHLEGPYINPQKKGAQPEQYIVPPNVEDFKHWAGPYLGYVRIMTLAPEIAGADALIRYLVQKGIIVSLGHTNATYADVDRAISLGARHVTHCGNAMRGMESREPGVLGAALARKELMAELIWDNIHVHPEVCRIIVEAKGARGVILISDGIPGAGMPDGYTFSLGDLPVVVTNGSARLPDGTLAGSLLTLEKAFKNATVFYDVQRGTALASYNAACALGLGHRKGRICAGYDADLVLLDAEGQVCMTMVGGHIAYVGGNG